MCEDRKQVSHFFFSSVCLVKLNNKMLEEDKKNREEDSGIDKQFYCMRASGYYDAMNKEIMLKRKWQKLVRGTLFNDTSFKKTFVYKNNYKIYTFHHHNLNVLFKEKTRKWPQMCLLKQQCYWEHLCVLWVGLELPNRQKQRAASNSLKLLTFVSAP